MRPVVAILSARPETIADDYVRWLDLVGIGPDSAMAQPFLAAETHGSGWKPGQVCPPWQVEAMLKCIGTWGEGTTAPLSMLTVKESGPSIDLRGFGWDDILDRHDLRPMDSGTMAAAPFRPTALLPALEGVLPPGFRLSPHLRGKDLVLASAMSLEPGGKLAGNVALLASMLAAERKTGGKIPVVEVLAEVVGLAREVFNSMLVVTDATVISVVRQGGMRVPLVRNLLLAGTDAVAVDSVLVRLAGLNAADCGWLNLCQDRGLGVADLAGIQLVGEPEWLDLDFRIPEDTFASGNPVASWSPVNLWKRMAGKSGAASSLSLDSAWNRLYRDFQSGVTS